MVKQNENEISENKALNHLMENHQKFDDWLKIHPVKIPEDVMSKIRAWEEEVRNPSLSFERWQELTEESRARRERARDPDGPDIDKYFQLYLLRNAPGSSKIEMGRLEEELADCFCGANQADGASIKYKHCHGK